MITLEKAISEIPSGWLVILGQGNIYRIDNPGDFWVADLVKIFFNKNTNKNDYMEVRGIGKYPVSALLQAIENAEKADLEQKETR